MDDLGAQPTASSNKLRVGEKPSEQGREPTQTQPTYDAGSGNRTRATLVGGERSHHCAIPAPRVVTAWLLLLCSLRGYPQFSF